MTLAAVEPVRITIPPQEGWIEPESIYRCEIPACVRAGSQWHHIVRRSQTGGPKDWISIDGLVIWNKAWICLWCHDDINNHNVWIRYVDGVWAVFKRIRLTHTPREGWIQNEKSGAWFMRIGQIGPKESREDSDRA